MSFAMCEMAWTSFKNGAKIYKTTAMQQTTAMLWSWLALRASHPPWHPQITFGSHADSES